MSDSAAAVARAFPWAVAARTARPTTGFAKGINVGAAAGQRALSAAAESRLRGRRRLRRPARRFRRRAPRRRHRRAAHPERRRHDPGFGPALSRLEHVRRRPELLADPEVPEQSAVALEPAGARRRRRRCRVSTGCRARACSCGATAFEQAGGMDERFFLYWEDADLCKRLDELGWRTIYFPEARSRARRRPQQRARLS